MSEGRPSLTRRHSSSVGQGGCDVQVGNLGQRMDAGVGAARAVDLESFDAGSLANGPFELALNRLRVRLNLPAAVARTGVFDRELESHRTYFGFIRSSTWPRLRSSSP